MVDVWTPREGEPWDVLVRAGQMDEPPGETLRCAVLPVQQAMQNAGTASSQRRRWVRRGGVVGVAAAACALVLLAPALNLNGDRPASSAQAAEILLGAADKVSAPDPAPVRQMYTVTVIDRSFVSDGELGPYLQSTREETWRPTATESAPTYTRYTVLDSVPLAGQPHSDVSISIGSQSVDRYGPGQMQEQAEPEGLAGWQRPTAAWLAQIPRDPLELRQRLYSDSAGRGTSADAEAAVYVGDLLRTGLVPPDLAASLYRVLATIPGVTLQDPAATPDGLTAAISYATTDQERTDLLINTSTGAFAGWRTTSLAGGSRVPAGTVQSQIISTHSDVSVPESVLRGVARQH